MQGLTIGVHCAAADPKGTIAAIVAAERAGIDVAWMTAGGVAADSLAVFAAAAGQTERIEFGTSIIPTFPRHPLALVQGAVVVDSLAPGRLRLGVGPSHKPAMEGTFGLNFDRPLEHLREYLAILNAALKEGKVSFHGKRLHAEAQLPAPTQVRVMASALRPNAFRLCGEVADGGISWVCPQPYLRDVAAPALAAGAKAAGSAKPPLVGHVPVVVSTDAEAVRAAATRQMGFYPRLPFYSSMFQDAGFPEAAGGEFSARMADALVVHGDEKAVAARIRALPSFGVDELLAMILVIPGDTTARDRTLELLGSLAKG
ncbi:MAG: LLM class flavin-dependent oxidoreductase [Chloroflexi bacterium]|nr:LLM class flavin-dependent oxidoreductase [Chloroflexota bacterium]